jgi:hypothetical protein
MQVYSSAKFDKFMGVLVPEEGDGNILRGWQFDTKDGQL